MKKILFKYKFIIITTFVAALIIIIGVFGLQYFTGGMIVDRFTQFKLLYRNIEVEQSPSITNKSIGDSLSESESDYSGLVSENIEVNDTYLGHFRYNEASQNNLIMIASYGQGEYQRFEYMDIEAGKALMKLIYAAREEGIWIIPVSGFRSIKKQNILFENQIKRRGSIEEAAKVSAPPGYSEHHTGLAVDLADGRYPNQDITQEFENTEAFRWLQKHAKEFNFEMSFPVNNKQGVIYEPWHWRFRG